MKALMRKKWNTLVAEDEEAMDLLVKVKEGGEVMCDITRPRNPQQHRLYMKLLHVVAENTEFVNIESLLSYIMRRLGRGEWYFHPDGTAQFVRKSIAFGSMDQTAFEKLWNESLDLIVGEIIPGTDRADLEAQVWDLVGYNYGEMK